MRRTLAVIATAVGCFSVPTTHAQDGRQILHGILGGFIGEVERQEQHRRVQELGRQIAPSWRACEAGNVAACQRAAQFPLNPQGRALLESMHRVAVIQRQVFDSNVQLCQGGDVGACDAALAYPFATEKNTLIEWRSAAMEEQERRQERDRIGAILAHCHAGHVPSCDTALTNPNVSPEDRAQIIASRTVNLKRQAAPKHAATSSQRSATTDSIGASSTALRWLPSDFGAVLVILVAALLSAALLVVKQREIFTAATYFRRALSSLFGRPQRTTYRGTTVMRDDRQALVSGIRHTSWSSPPPDFKHASVMVPGQDKMKIKMRRDQAAGITGKITFSVNFIAELSPEAREAVRRYRFGKTVLYQKNTKLDATMNIFRLLWRLLWLWLTRRRWQITINDLVNGRTIECKDILEVLDVEEQIMGAAKSFASVLRAASWFGGEEIVQL